MADVVPNYNVEQQRLIMAIAQFNHNIERYKFEIVEMEDRKEKTIVNIRATKKAIKEAEKNLAALVAEHGKAEPPDFSAAEE